MQTTFKLPSSMSKSLSIFSKPIEEIHDSLDKSILEDFKEVKKFLDYADSLSLIVHPELKNIVNTLFHTYTELYYLDNALFVAENKVPSLSALRFNIKSV